MPKNLPPGEKIPALLIQTRYWRYEEMRAPFKWFMRPEDLAPDMKGFKPYFTSHGYALVYVDVRGTGASFGVWPYPWSEESFEDAREIVDWIITQSWSNGRVGAMGISYVGTTAELLAALQHPAVMAVAPLFNHPDAYTDIAFPGGVLNARFIRQWGAMDLNLDNNIIPTEYGWQGRLLLHGVKPVDGHARQALLKQAIQEHASNGNVYSMACEITFRDQPHPQIGRSVDELSLHKYNDALLNTHTAILGWGSWMDAGTADAVLRRFLTYPSAQRAVIGAWEHGGRFHASPHQPHTIPGNPPPYMQWRELLRFFDTYLKDVDNGLRSERLLFYYTMGEEKWKSTSTWPPLGVQLQRWFLAENRVLARSTPENDSGEDTYPVDFHASTGAYNRWWELSGLSNQTVHYPDRTTAQYLLSYTSPPLEQDLEITGYPVVNLYISSSEPDCVFYVYLEEVDPGGRATYITEGLLRAIHRKVSDQTPPYQLQVPYHTFKEADAMPLIPGETVEITFGLLPTSVLIRKGHRIRLSLAGHDEGTFARIPAEGTPVITVFRTRLHASWIDLPVLRR